MTVEKKTLTRRLIDALLAAYKKPPRLGRPKRPLDLDPCNGCPKTGVTIRLLIAFLLIAAPSCFTAATAAQA